MIIAALIVGLIAAGFAISAWRAVQDWLDQAAQHEPDEHADWLGADAGGSFIHHGSVSE